MARNRQYVTGTPHPNQSATAGFEFKAPDSSSSGGRGGGYPRWRSYEHRPDSSRRGKEDVYVSVHRLAAVAWCFPDDWTAADILDSEQLVGTDVHHALGMPSANVEGEIELRSHGDHAAITQFEKRAWAETAKQQAIGSDDGSDGCPQCDASDPTLVSAEGIDGEVCLDCAADHPDAGTIEL